MYLLNAFSRFNPLLQVSYSKRSFFGKYQGTTITLF